MRNSSILLSMVVGACLLAPAAQAQHVGSQENTSSPLGIGAIEGTTNYLGEIEPSVVIPNSNVVAAGVGLRQREFGCINTHGIPDGAQILGAYLYWAYIAPAPIPNVHDVMDFRRFRPGPQYIQENFVRGDLCGMGADPCWFHPGTNYVWVFRAEVTQWILGSPGANPKRNGAYFVRAHPDAQGNPNFGDPWAGPPVSPLLEGASLVIVYRGGDNHEEGNGYYYDGTTYIYDTEVPPFNKALCAQTFDGCSGLYYTLDNMFAPQQTCAKFIQIGADGQSAGSGGRGGCVADEEFSIERTTVSVPNSGNYFYVSGPGSEYHNSDWNGMDGNCLPQLWDTACHDITPLFSASGASVTSLDVEVRNYDCYGNPCPGGPSDCLVPVANIVHICDAN